MFFQNRPWIPHLDSRKGRDLGAGGEEDVLGVDELLAAVFCGGRHLVLTGHPPKSVEMCHLRGVTSWTPLSLIRKRTWRTVQSRERGLTLFCLNRWAIPPVNALTAPLFCAIIFSRFNEMPETDRETRPPYFYPEILTNNSHWVTNIPLSLTII